MLQALIITLREGVEAALIVGITLAYLNKIARPELRKLVYWALGAAFFQNTRCLKMNLLSEGTTDGTRCLHVLALGIHAAVDADSLRDGDMGELVAAQGNHLPPASFHGQP